MNESDDKDKTIKCVCHLKWFNESKGFGFVVPEESDNEHISGQDAFVHVSAFQKQGIQSLGQNAKISCDITETEKGLFVDCINDLICPGDECAQKIKIPLPPEAGETYEMRGVVKWYRADKEYGFISGEDREKDIFIHHTVVKRNQIDENDLQKGTHVIMSVRNVDQGREAVSITIDSDSDNGNENENQKTT